MPKITFRYIADARLDFWPSKKSNSRARDGFYPLPPYPWGSKSGVNWAFPGHLFALIRGSLTKPAPARLTNPAGPASPLDRLAQSWWFNTQMGAPEGFTFKISHTEKGLARAGTISTPHGKMETPCFVPVATKATVKSVLPETMKELGSQALLANAYHLYLQPGPDVIDEAGGLSKFMNWPGPTFTDSGGFQVLSLGMGFKKVLAMDASTFRADDVIALNKDRLAHVDDDGVTFKSHLDGAMHRFTPEISMQVQHQIGADIIFAFDECTTLHNTRRYQEGAVDRTTAWAIRCLDEHQRQSQSRKDSPYQALFGVIQGAQYEDLRRRAAKNLGEMVSSGISFDGFGIGGALDKGQLGTIISWVNQELPEDKPKHLLGIGAPEDLFVGVANGIDTFDCVLASRIARTSAVYTMEGRFNVSNAPYRRQFVPIDDECDCYTCLHYTRGYLNHLFRGKEILAATLATIHNERFIVRLVDQMRDALKDGSFLDLRSDFLARYSVRPVSSD